MGKRLFVWGALGSAVTLTSGESSAGAPAPCTGYETRTCEDGRVVTHCCPQGSRCNYRNPPHVGCGHGLCVEGADASRCPAPRANALAVSDEAECKTKHGEWAEACIDHTVKFVCLPPMPTNYMGPGNNPAFQRCNGDRCTTHVFLEDCFPTRAELGDRVCEGTFVPVCLEGRVAERCVPVATPLETLPAAKFVSCPDGSCAVGASANACLAGAPTPGRDAVRAPAIPPSTQPVAP